MVGGILLLALSHWFVGGPDKHLNNLLYNLNFVPILVGGMLMGWRTAVFATLLTLVAEMPHLWLFWPHDETYRMDQIFETFASGIGGVVVGLLASKSRRQRTKLETHDAGTGSSESGDARQPGAAHKGRADVRGGATLSQPGARDSESAGKHLRRGGHTEARQCQCPKTSGNVLKSSRRNRSG